MKKSRKLAMGLILFAMAAVLSVPVGASAAKGKINKKKVTITVGKTVKLKVKNIKKKVKWSSGKKKVAKVSKKGVVKGLRAGKATITAKAGKKKFRCKVTVKKKKKKSSSKNTGRSNGGSGNTGNTGGSGGSSTGGSTGTNIPIAGDVFKIGGKNLALGLTEQQVRTILGTANIVRTDKTPQGFDAIIYNPWGNYKDYMIVQLADGVVAGLCGVSMNMSYADIISAGTGSTSLESSDAWSPVSWYTAQANGTEGGEGAYKTTAGDATVVAFVDSFGAGNTYCIQVFSNKYSFDTMTKPSTKCSYADNVLEAVKTETLELLNAYCVFCGTRTLKKGPKATAVAQAYSDTLAASGVSDAVSRNSDDVFNALYDGGLDPMYWGESALMGSSDAIGFANSIIESKGGRENLLANDPDDMKFTHVGVGFSVHEGSSQYKTYLVLDYYSL